MEGRRVGQISDISDLGVPAQQGDQALAPRLAAVHGLLRVGKSNKEVARDLDLQEKTIKHYMTAILQKLQELAPQEKIAELRFRVGPTA